MTTATIILLLLLIIGTITSLYFLGFLPNTPPYYQKRFNNYYLDLLNASNCDRIRYILENNEDSGFINYITQHADTIEQRYPRDLLKNKINPMNCTYSDGTSIEF